MAKTEGGNWAWSMGMIWRVCEKKRREKREDGVGWKLSAKITQKIEKNKKIKQKKSHINIVEN